MEKLWQFQWRNIPFSAWLYRIAINEINYYFRKNKYKNISLETVLEDTTWEPIDACNLEDELKEAEKILEDHCDFLLIQKKLLTLPRKYQEVLSLKYFGDKKISEISIILDKKENTVKSLLKRGLHLLKQQVQKEKRVQPISSSLITESESP